MDTLRADRLQTARRDGHGGSSNVGYFNTKEKMSHILGKLKLG